MRKTQTVGVLPITLAPGVINNRPQYKRNTLFLNRGDGTYAEIAQLSGLAATEWSWMPAFIDLDLDGYEDLLVTTGHILDSLNADAVAAIMRARSNRKLTDEEHRQLKRKHYPLLNLPNQAFRNRGDLTFEDKATEWGFDFIGISQALCLADLDNGNLKFTTDFRSVYASVLQGYLNAPASELLGGNYEILPLLKA